MCGFEDAVWMVGMNLELGERGDGAMHGGIGST